MKHIILVHGMNATAASWNTVPKLLKTNDNTVKTVDLPGHDLSNKISVYDLAELGFSDSSVEMTDYIDSVVDAFPSGTDRDICLIGHSMGGAVISHVARKHPDRIADLVYIAALLPDNKQSISDLINMSRAEPPFSLEKFIATFTAHPSVTLVQQPKGPLPVPFERTEEFEGLRRTYIRCTEDNVIPIKVQDQMISAYANVTPKIKVATLQRGHLPQYDDPEELAELLKKSMA
ncbi:alpha/beta fold hydrolase [Coralliovum pocilloporae]|uniref:alpha/beta fold hydrolase n=1 Tax=Coralliovum pocilloporae TaxID=3066369 RepID=UPI0033074142